MNEEKGIRSFALVANNEVFHKWNIEEDYDNMYVAALIYGLQSNPIVIDITDKENRDAISLGWSLDEANNFIEPDMLQVPNKEQIS